MEIALSDCPICKEKQPVLSLETEEGIYVGCTVCKTILNKLGNVKVEYYDLLEIHKVSKWKFTENGEVAGELYREVD